MRVDRSKPHPFYQDTETESGYKLGCPAWFDVVDDDQLIAPRDDRGLATHRRQTISWRYRPDILGVGGMSKNEPMKADEDTCDSTRMITSNWGPSALPLTEDEELERNLPKSLRRDSLASLPAGTSDYAMLQRNWELAQLKEARNRQRANWSTN